MSLARKLGVIIARAEFPQDSRAHLMRFIGSCAHIIAVAGIAGAEHVTVAIADILGRRELAGEKCAMTEDARVAMAREIAMVIGAVPRADIETFARVHGARIGPTACTRISRIFREIPALDGVLEFAQHADLAIVREANDKHRLHLHAIDVRVGAVPLAREWARRGPFDSIFINALGMRGVTYVIVRGIEECIEKDARIFALIAHDETCAIASKYLVARATCSAIALSAFTGSEKRAISVSDVMIPS
jgi:hypothetical protein